MLMLILIIVVVFAVLGAFPHQANPVSREWGYGPSGGLVLVVAVLVVLYLMGHRF